MGTERATFDGTAPSGRPVLEISNNSNPQKRIYEIDKPVLSLGRDLRNDLVIDTPIVSARHVQIVREGMQFVLIHPHPERARTANGLIYNGRTIAGDEHFRTILARGDIFRISDEHGTYVSITYNDGTGATQQRLPDIRPIPLNKPTITIGRVADNDVVLNHPQVSSHHARLVQVQGGYRIEDLGSTNHVYVNGPRISKQLLKPNDEIRIGPFRLTYTGTQLTQYDESNSIRIDAAHIKRFGDRHKVLVNDISLVIPPRTFVAIVGGSGAGKSTLMDTLNGRRPAQDGKVYYNGQDYYQHLAAFSTQLGYVPQKDIIHGDLTVERALYYAAKLRLPDDYTNEQIKQRITEVLEDVEMADRRQLMIKKLSGGQQKRVSIALELLANPSVFFLDEPTSGLDPGLDRKMMALLRRLADRGRTIILVTHATNNINFCDYVCFLCKGGRLAYYGPPDEAKVYFDKADFAEIYSALEPADGDENKEPAQAEARFRQSVEYRRYIEEPLSQGPASGRNVLAPTAAIKQPKRGNPWKQFRLLSMRYMELLKNDLGNLAILLLQAPAIGLILLALASQSTFSPTSVVTCPPNPQIPNTVGARTSCQNEINAFNTPQGQVFMQQHGFSTPEQATQQFIIPGSGQDAQKILLIMAFAAVMFGCINGAREIVKESSIYQRERAVNLGIVPYMFSKIAVLGIFCLLQSAILVAMVNAKAPFQHSTFLPSVLEIYITLSLTSLAGLMLGLVLSAVVPNNDRAMSFVPLILIPQIIFSGAIFALNSPILQFIGIFFSAHWAMAGMGSTVGLHGDKVLAGDNFIYQGTLFSTTSGAQAVLHLLLVWFILVAMIVALGFAIAYFLKRKDVRA